MRPIDEWTDDEVGPVSLEEDDSGCLWTVASNLDGEFGGDVAVLQRRVASLAEQRQGKVLVDSRDLAAALLRWEDAKSLRGKLLVSRADLETAIVDRTAADGQAAICHWPGCEFYETLNLAGDKLWHYLKPHSAHCPLAEETNGPTA